MFGLSLVRSKCLTQVLIQFCQSSEVTDGNQYTDEKTACVSPVYVIHTRVTFLKHKSGSVASLLKTLSPTPSSFISANAFGYNV